MNQPAIWFPTIRAGSGADTFTEQLVHGLNHRGLRAEITWLPHRAEYAPWSEKPPPTPPWANVVHVNTWLSCRYLPQSLPVVATVHHCVQDPAYAPCKTPMQKLYHRLWVTPQERRLIKRTSRLIAVSRYTAGQVRSIFDVDAVSVIHNGVDTAAFTPAARQQAHRPFRLLFAGNPSRRKGFDLIPEIMRRLGSEFELHFTTGRGVSLSGLPGNMHGRPRLACQSDMAEAYRNADALLFPSRLEGFGLVAAEAMACGLPVVASRSSALSELIEDGVTGRLCTPGDVAGFADAIRQLVANESLRQQMGDAARRRIEQDFRLEMMVDSYIRTYRDALSIAQLPEG